MKKVGLFFENQISLNAAFFMRAYSSLDDPNDNAIIKTNSREIIYPDITWSYIIIKDEKDLVKISGLEFDAIFSEVTDIHCKQYIMSRFRPRSLYK